MTGRAWGVVLALTVGVAPGWQAQTVPTYTTQLLTTPDSSGVEVTWTRDATVALTWGHVLVCPDGDPGVPQGCFALPAFRDSTFPATGTARAWVSLAGLADKTLTWSVCVATQYGSVARSTYPCPKLAHSLTVPATAPPRPPPVYGHWRHDTTATGDPLILYVMATSEQCPVSLEYNETPGAQLYTWRTSDPRAACIGAVARANAEWNP